jgi:hypothetical protein
MKINKYKYLVFIIGILFFLFFITSCVENRNEKDIKLYELSKNYKSIALAYAYRNIKLSQEQTSSLKTIINNRSFKEYEDKSFPGLCSIFVILICNGREVYIRLSSHAWSFWDKEKTIMRQYKKGEPIWRKYKHPNSTKTIFYKIFYELDKSRVRERVLSKN